MENTRSFVRQPQLVLCSLAVTTLVAGVVYYLMFRVQGNALAAFWPALAEFRQSAIDPTAGTLPAFLHMSFLGFTATALLGLRIGGRVAILLFAITVAAECFIGTFDWADLFLALSGGLLSLLVSAKVYEVAVKHGYSRTEQTARATTTKITAALVASSAVLIGASYSPCIYCGDEYQTRAAIPVYISYDQLRNAVAVESPRPIEDIGRIYLYSNYIFLNKKNQGIHVLDNTDPANPENVRFISIPGNTELSIRNNYLYADSYVDLVTLNLNDPDNISVSNRQTDIFPWDEYQNVTDDVYFNYADIDQNRGVVVSYELK